VAIDVRPATFIDRSRHDVANYMFDPAHDTEWTGGITASRPAQPGLLAVGSTVERDARFLGRTFTYGYVVTDHQPDRLVELKVERPFPMLVRYELDDHGPLMRPAVRKSIAADLERLRARLER
jgi:hypothetical protein